MNGAETTSSGTGYARLAATTALVNVLLAGAGFLAPLLISRQFGPEGRGEIAAILTMPTLMASIFTLGIPVATTYFVAMRPDQAISTVRLGASVAVVTGAIGLLVAGIASTWFLSDQRDEVRVAGLVACVSVLLLPVLGTLVHPLRSIGRYRAWNVARACFELALLVAVIVALVFGVRDFVELAALYVMALLPGFVVGCVAWRGSGRRRADASRRAMLRVGAPAMLAALPYYLNYRLDQVVLLRATDPRTLGEYATAVTWASASLAIVNAFHNTALTRVVQSDPKDADATAAHHVRLTVTTAIVTGLVVAVAAPVAIPLAFGSDFGPAVPYAVLLSVITPLLGVAVTIEEVLRPRGDAVFPAIAQTVGLGFNLVALLVLVPALSAWGAAVASAVTYVLVVLVLVRRLRARSTITVRELVPDFGEFVRTIRSLRGGTVRRSPGSID